MQTNPSGLSTRYLVIFAMLGAMMFVSRLLMMAIPNVHVLGLFIAAFTLTYRARALMPIYVFVLLDGLYQGFSIWWIPNLYVWLPLWLAFMAVGKANLTSKSRPPIYMVLCALHGLSFGTIYAPAHALFFGLSFYGMLAWIAAGLYFDIIHAIGNFAAATLVVPLVSLLKKLD
ncbi:MAG: hypothetical protein FWF78_05630 [Defluviitaleaceae bacterium]|nr:hypothetical protein [Defluviitaleaceae bacterium]